MPGRGGVTPAARLAAAIELLTAIGREERPADAVAQAFFRDRRFIGSADRRAVSAQVWGVLRGWRRLGWWLARVDLPDTPPLRLATALLLEGWTEAGVTQCFSGGRYAPAKLAAVDVARLRDLVGHTLDHPEQDLAVRTELPDFLLAPLEARFGPALEAEMRAMLTEAPLDLRVNALKATREEAIAALAAEGIEASPTPHSAWGLRVEGRRPVVTGAAFRTGLVEIQDEGSQLIADLVGAAPEMRVADYCAGAGGKTLAMAMAMRNRGHIVALDVSAPRLEAAGKRLRRAGVHNVERHLIEPGDKWAKRRAGGFERVLVDAPCSGTGTWRRNPDARLSLRETDIEELIVKQGEIIQAASALVKPGGRLIYATCSLLPRENEGQVAMFLARNEGFRPVGAALSLTPRRDGTDGFFAQALERVA